VDTQFEPTINSYLLPSMKTSRGEEGGRKKEEKNAVLRLLRPKFGFADSHQQITITITSFQGESKGEGGGKKKGKREGDV